MIKLLDKQTIDQIAAGEVIERPMAVVKELIENSLDASATAITIEIKEGGISFIRVTDNGSGINANEIKTAFLRHATSKIESALDLLNVSSLGFRGEALSSIASVSQVELITREEEEITGIRYIIEGGEEKGCEQIGSPKGTTFISRNLFYNTPARRKFLKSPKTEGTYIEDLVARYCLARPNIRFTLISDGKNKIQSSGDGQLKANIFYQYGKELTKLLIPIEASNEYVKVTGYIGKPEYTRGNKNYISTFVNGRYIKSSVINEAIMNAYKGYLMQHRFPFCCLLIEVDSKDVDVNVHPTKMEVRFSNEQALYDLISSSITDALENSILIPVAPIKEEKSVVTSKPITNVPNIKKAEPFEKVTLEKEKTEEVNYVKENTTYNKPSFERDFLENKNFVQTSFEEEKIQVSNVPEFRIIGQVFETYWLIEYKEELLIIDQHAAHEKILYEKLIKTIEEKNALTQNLAVPIIISLSGKEIDCLNDNADVFSKLGFKYKSFGDNDYQIYGVPADFIDVDHKELFIDLLAEIMTHSNNKQSQLVLEKCASMACKAAVKGNNILSFAEAKKLIEQMLMMEHPYHCPHGRPTTIAMTKQEFEKKFKRIV